MTQTEIQTDAAKQRQATIQSFFSTPSKRPKLVVVKDVVQIVTLVLASIVLFGLIVFGLRIESAYDQLGDLFGTEPAVEDAWAPEGGWPEESCDFDINGELVCE